MDHTLHTWLRVVSCPGLQIYFLEEQKAFLPTKSSLSPQNVSFMVLRTLASKFYLCDLLAFFSLSLSLFSSHIMHPNHSFLFVRSTPPLFLVRTEQVKHRIAQCSKTGHNPSQQGWVRQLSRRKKVPSAAKRISDTTTSTVRSPTKIPS